MTQDTRFRFIVIVLLTAFCAYVVAPIKNKPILDQARIKPGIDLAGGAELRYRLVYTEDQRSRAKELTTDAADIVRQRLEAKQLKEPKITPEGDDRIVVQIPGVDRAGLESYKKLIGVGGKLELYAVAPGSIQTSYNETRQVPDGYMAIENPNPLGGEHAMYGSVLLLRKPPVITGRNVVASEPRQELTTRGTEWVTSFELDTEGAKLFDEAAERLYNERPRGLIAIVLDGKLQSAPVVNSPSFQGHGQISGAKSQEDARDLSIILRSGSLPAEMKLDSETFVGPTLGQDAIRRGVWASGATLVLVAVFMIIYYRQAGVLAVLSLLLNLLFLLAIMSFAGATMTLPGIAGIVLTVGMAVDANILIMERIREEQAKGKSALQCYEAGHERAFSAILDSNVTTLLAAAVLYYFGTGPVKGFAVTLSIGILTTLFSVLFCGRVFLKMLVTGGLTEFKMLRLMSAPNFDYLRRAARFVTVSALLVVGFVALTAARRDKILSIDFKGGTVISFSMLKPVKIEEVRQRIASIKGADGLPKYPDAEIQTIASPDATRAEFKLGGGEAADFQLRTGVSGGLQDDLQTAFPDLLSHEPFTRMKPEEASPNPLIIDGEGPAGPGWWMYFQADKFNLEDVRKKIAENRELHAVLSTNTKNETKFHFEPDKAGSPPNVVKAGLHLAKADAEREGRVEKTQEILARIFADSLTADPFSAQRELGPAVADELADRTVWALLVSWALMIVYVAIRFSSWRYGVASVIALVHDSIISIGFIALAGAVVPKTWGLSFDMGLTTLAAILTIIGYAINDKIVVFDRIRENLLLMKKASFAEVLNASVNQTMSRTILTGVMVWVASIILYGLTMHTGGGIAEFAFPLIVGILAGTYSTIFVAVPIVYWWYKGKRPEAA